MAWIIEDNMKKYKVRCPNCDSIIGFTTKDEMANSEEYFGEYHNYSTVRCPACRKHIILVLMERDWVWSLYDIIKNIVLAWNYQRVWFSFYLVAML